MNKKEKNSLKRLINIIRKIETIRQWFEKRALNIIEKYFDNPYVLLELSYILPPGYLRFKVVRYIRELEIDAP